MAERKLLQRILRPVTVSPEEPPSIVIDRLILERGARRGPACDAEVGDHTAHFRRRAGRDLFCDAGALYRATCPEHTMNLCGRHAGELLLRASVYGRDLVSWPSKKQGDPL